MKVFSKIKFIVMSLFLGFSPVWAQDLTYDRYGAVYVGDSAEAAPRSSFNPIAEVLTLPFSVLKWPMSKALVYFEKNHLDKKAVWVYDQFRNRGIYPKLGSVAPDSFSTGVDVDFIELLDQKTNFSDFRLKGGLRYKNNTQFKLDGEIGWQDYTDTGLGISGLIMYESRPEEHFYGIGPNTSAGDGASFKMETTEVGSRLSYHPHPLFKTDFSFSYSNINITNGEDGGRNIIDDIFPRGSIPGLSGDELLNFKLEFSNDTRNHKVSSTKGGLRRMGVSFHEGLGSSDASFFKYYTELSQYLKLGNERRVLALHFYGEHNDELNKNGIPFHQMVTLGGGGVSPRLSHTLRGYDFNRFFDESALLFNLEYRYNIWQYRDFRLDTVFFWDEGQVFGEPSKFQFKDFRESYGVGFRLTAAHHLLFDVEIAHGDEGTNLYLKTKAPF